MKRNSNNSHFIYADRKIIEEGVNENMSISQIAYNMKRNKSSILREIDRNKTYIFPSTFNNSHPCIKHKNCPVKEFNCLCTETDILIQGIILAANTYWSQRGRELHYGNF